MKDTRRITLFVGDPIGFVSLVDRTGEDPALKVANSARISYDKRKTEFGPEDKKLTGYLWEAGHTSPFRHSFYTFHIKAPLFLFRQAFKYQVGSCWREYEVDGNTVSVDIFDVMFDTDKGCSWNEVSGRYVELKPEFYIPRTMRTNSGHANKQASSELPETFDHVAAVQDMDCAVTQSWFHYQSLLKKGVAKEIARMVLPQNIYSQAYWTVSLQGLLHFFDQRLKPDAQLETVKLAEGIKRLVSSDLARLGIWD